MSKTRSQQRADVQDAVVTAARRLFVEKGYKETTLTDISLASGIHIGSIYNIFRDKEDIVCEIAVRAAKALSAEAKGLIGEPTAGGCMLFPSAETLTLASYNPRFARLMCVAYSSAKTTETGLEMQRANLTRSLASRGIEFDQDEIMSTLCACNGAMAGILTRYCDTPRSDVRKDLLILARVYGSLLGSPRDPEAAVDSVLRLVEEHPPESLLLGSMDPGELAALRRGDGTPSPREEPPRADRRPHRIQQIPRVGGHGQRHRRRSGRSRGNYFPIVLRIHPAYRIDREIGRIAHLAQEVQASGGHPRLACGLEDVACDQVVRPQALRLYRLIDGMHGGAHEPEAGDAAAPEAVHRHMDPGYTEPLCDVDPGMHREGDVVDAADDRALPRQLLVLLVREVLLPEDHQLRPCGGQLRHALEERLLAEVPVGDGDHGLIPVRT